MTSLITYTRVGRLLHVIALLDLCIVVLLSRLLFGVDDLAIVLFILTGIVTFLTQLILSQLDAYSRYQNYKQLKDQLYINGFQKRLIMPMSKSRCQRDSARVACRELHMEENLNKLFHQLGYRWYHIPPDFVFVAPMFFFTNYFWRTTFFVPYYKPKFDYANLNLTSETMDSPNNAYA